MRNQKIVQRRMFNIIFVTGETRQYREDQVEFFRSDGVGWIKDWESPRIQINRDHVLAVESFVRTETEDA